MVNKDIARKTTRNKIYYLLLLVVGLLDLLDRPTMAPLEDLHRVGFLEIAESFIAWKMHNPPLLMPTPWYP